MQNSARHIRLASSLNPYWHLRQKLKSYDMLAQYLGRQMDLVVLENSILNPLLQMIQESPLMLSCWQLLALQVPSGNRVNPSLHLRQVAILVVSSCAQFCTVQMPFWISKYFLGVLQALMEES